MAKIAFDIDDTLYKVVYEIRNGIHIPIGQIPDYEIINLLISFHNLGNDVFIWSAGGLDYTLQIGAKLGLQGYCTPIPKDKVYADGLGIDITFDDQEVTLGKVNIRILREKYGDNNAS